MSLIWLFLSLHLCIFRSQWQPVFLFSLLDGRITINTSILLNPGFAAVAVSGRWQVIKALKNNPTGLFISRSIVGEFHPMSAVLKEKEVVLLPSFVLDKLNLYLKSTQGSLWQQCVGRTVAAAHWVPVLNNELYLINRLLETVLT